MPPNKCRVTRFDLWINPAFDARLRQESDIVLDICALRADESAIRAALVQADIYHISPARNELPTRWHVDAALIEQLPNLLCVSSSGAGFDTVDAAACTRAGIAVVNQAGANAISVAEHAIGLMLSVSRHIAESDRLLRTERGFSRENLMGHEIHGKVLGVVGLGHTGSITARYAQALGMTVLATDPLIPAERIAAAGATAVDLKTLLAQSDIVSLHCPLDEATRQMVDAAAFAAMKKGAIFISTARGGVHDEAALFESLANGHLAGAGVDVWDLEPPPLDHPLLTLPNVVATFHTAGVSHEARETVASMAAAQIVDVFRGKRPARLINPQVWPAYAKRFERRFGRAPGA